MAVSQIAGCQQCRGDEAQNYFDCILAEVLSKPGPFEFLLTGIAHCPACNAALTERSLVEPTSGLEVEATL
jgi:hypothetical protein